MKLPIMLTMKWKKKHTERFISATINSCFKEDLAAFRKMQFSPMFKVTKEYMDNFESILLFICASREGNWMAHLASLERLCPIFFHQDRVKYAQHVPDYFPRIYKDSDPDIWKEITNGNLCVKKSLTPFTIIGVDHVFEQENRKMKVLGGLKGITQKQETLAKREVKSLQQVKASGIQKF